MPPLGRAIEDHHTTGNSRQKTDARQEARIAEAHPAWAAEMKRVHGLAELIVARQRHGAAGKVRLRFEPKITRFTDFAEGDYGGGDWE